MFTRGPTHNGCTSCIRYLAPGNTRNRMILTFKSRYQYLHKWFFPASSNYIYSNLHNNGNAQQPNQLVAVTCVHTVFSMDDKTSLDYYYFLFAKFSFHSTPKIWMPLKFIEWKMTWESDSRIDSEFCKRNVSSCEFHLGRCDLHVCVSARNRLCNGTHDPIVSISMAWSQSQLKHLIEQKTIYHEEFSPFSFVRNQCVWPNGIQLEWYRIVKRHRWKMKNFNSNQNLCASHRSIPPLASLATMSIPTIFTVSALGVACISQFHRILWTRKMKLRNNSDAIEIIVVHKWERSECIDRLDGTSAAGAQWKWNRP